MATVIKGNSLITIPDDRVEDYLNRGYDLASPEGAVIKKAVPTDLAELRKLYTDHVAEIANLKKELAKGDKDNKELEKLKTDYNNLVLKYKELEDENTQLKTEIEKLKAPKKNTRTNKKTGT